MLFSIVIPFDGDRTLSATLHALARQVDGADCEVLVVHPSDRVLPDLPNNVQALSVDRALLPHSHTAGALRNRGAALARGERLLFLDSDCLPTTGWLRTYTDLVAAATDRDRLVLCGQTSEVLPTFLDQRQADDSIDHDALRYTSVPDDRLQAWETFDETSAWRGFYSCNTSVPTELFRRVGGFDETGNRCHDLALGYRLSLGGARFVFSPDAWALHVEHPRSAWFRLSRIAGLREIANRHPELSTVASDMEVDHRIAATTVIERARRAFAAITRDVPGIDVDYTRLVPASSAASLIFDRLKDIQRLTVADDDHVRHFVRLDRSCWDFSILQRRAQWCERPYVSVVIPAYNAAATIERCVDSVLGQSMQVMEIVIIDDGSTDSTLLKLRRYFSVAPMRIVSSGRNRGLAYALNTALANCRGECLLHLDADDWLHPLALERLRTCVAKNTAVGSAYGDPFLIGRDGVARRRQGTAIEGFTDALEYGAVQAPRAYRVDLLKQLAMVSRFCLGCGVSCPTRAAC